MADGLRKLLGYQVEVNLQRDIGTSRENTIRIMKYIDEFHPNVLGGPDFYSRKNVNSLFYFTDMEVNANNLRQDLESSRLKGIIKKVKVGMVRKTSREQ